MGKIYNVLARKLASCIHRQVHGVKEATVWLYSTIGQRIDRPSMAVAQVSLSKGVTRRRVQGSIQWIVRDSLDGLKPFCEALARGKYSVY